MEITLQVLPWVSVYIDDILVTGKTPKDHLKNLEAVLTRLEKIGLAKAQTQKCEFLLPSVKYLGYKVSAKGLQPT